MWRPNFQILEAGTPCLPRYDPRLSKIDLQGGCKNELQVIGIKKNTDRLYDGSGSIELLIIGKADALGEKCGVGVQMSYI